jgi:hypothetical protein
MSEHKSRARKILPAPDITSVIGNISELKKACDAALASLEYSNLQRTQFYHHLVSTKEATELVLKGLSFNYITPRAFDHVWDGILTKKDVTLHRRD